ncbi:unnamed protein product [Acanthocheilonema viteae]|uniref:Uncharacterized protein n=1 Tax=Acanthocheilonema viteae TaxID=6277 RepID=A0A498S220_ACAVI|nr:unnamed protein product [Acanthocheilonema viteae]
MNFFSNSTSRLIVPRRKRSGIQSVQPDTFLTTCKYASAEGRFSIIDKRHKESANMESTDSSSDDEMDFTNKKTVFTGMKYDHHVLFQSSTANSTTSSQQQSQLGLKKSKQMNGSRFRIVPLESRYERGRWACWDFYNTEPPKQHRERHSSPLPLFSSSSLSTKSFINTRKLSMFSPVDNVPHTAPPNDQQSTTFSFDFSNDSDTDNHLTTKACGSCKKSGQLSSKPSKFEKKTNKDLLKNNADNQNKLKSNKMETELALSGRMTPVEMLNNFGLERSLSATYSDNRYVQELLPGTMPQIGNSGMNNRPNKHIGCEKVERHVLEDYHQTLI